MEGISLVNYDVLDDEVKITFLCVYVQTDMQVFGVNVLLEYFVIHEFVFTAQVSFKIL